MPGSCSISRIHEGLRFDPASMAEQIERFVRAEVERLDKRGVVLGLSGGLDSTVCAYLCVCALGKKRVRAFILPERDSDAQNIRDAELVAQTLGLDATCIDLTPILTQLGVYDLISKEWAANRRAIEMGLRWLARVTQQPSAFSQALALLYTSHPNHWERLMHRLLWRPAAHVYAFAITKVRCCTTMPS